MQHKYENLVKFFEFFQKINTLTPNVQKYKFALFGPSTISNMNWKKFWNSEAGDNSNSNFI